MNFFNHKFYEILRENVILQKNVHVFFGINDTVQNDSRFVDL